MKNITLCNFRIALLIRIKESVKYRMNKFLSKTMNWVLNLPKSITFFFNIEKSKIIFYHSQNSHLQNSYLIRKAMSPGSFSSINSFAFHDSDLEEKYGKPFHWRGNLVKLKHNSYFVTPHSDFRKEFIHKNSTLIHLMHSLMPIENVYDDFAFDDSDIIVIPANYHISEFINLANSRGEFSRKILWPAGYPKIDLIKNRISEDSIPNNLEINLWDEEPKKFTVLLAPTLSYSVNEEFTFGVEQIFEIVSKLIILEYRVIFRPHPVSRNSSDRILIQMLLGQFGNNKSFMLDSNADYYNSYKEADLIVTDYSGTGLTFAWGFNKPCIFMSPEIDFLRGYNIRFTRDLKDLFNLIENEKGSGTQPNVKELDNIPVFNIGSSSQKFLEYIEYLKGGNIHPDWIFI